MEETDHLRLPYLIAAQAQKHVTHNEALRALDAIVHLAVDDRDLTAPPASPSDGERYLVAASATGDWAGHDGEIAAFQDGAWMYYSPKEGWIAWVSDEDAAIAFDGTNWVALSSGGGGGSVNPTPLVGVNATADTTNRLSVSAPATLLSHEGNGHQLKINKAASGDTGSLLYQTGFSGRAEIGLTGDDDFHFKVSADGTAWNDAILIDKDTGEVSFPNTTIGGGGGFTPFASRAVVRQTSSDTCPNAPTQTTLSWQNEVEDIGGWFDPGSPTRFTVPSGISLVELTALLKLSAAAGNNGSIKIEHYNSSDVLQDIYLNGFNFKLQINGAINTPPVAVSPGDYFTIVVVQNSGSTRTTDTNVCVFTIAGIA
ncbi:MAG: DUF2793 domain-containing protein [Alphaproteobacteria bacterium]|nr:DUF2793 domain-containing protein [Alphaproteobacteria bacterium]